MAKAAPNRIILVDGASHAPQAQARATDQLVNRCLQPQPATDGAARWDSIENPPSINFPFLLGQCCYPQAPACVTAALYVPCWAYPWATSTPPPFTPGTSAAALNIVCSVCPSLSMPPNLSSSRHLFWQHLLEGGISEKIVDRPWRDLPRCKYWVSLFMTVQPTWQRRKARSTITGCLRQCGNKLDLQLV